MKRKAVTILLSLCTLVVLVPSFIVAEVISSETTVTIGPDEVIDDDLFIVTESLTINGTINGDVYAAAGTIDINGTVNGDVYVAAGVLTISGTVADDVIGAGGMITIKDATVGDSIVAVGGSISTSSTSSTKGGLVFVGGVVNISGHIARGVTGGGKTVSLDATVGRDVTLGVENFSIGSRAEITGDINYTSNREAIVNQHALIGGTVLRTAPPAKVGLDFNNQAVRDAIRQARTGFTIFAYLSTLLIGWIVLTVARKPFNDSARLVSKEPVIAGFAGLVSFVLFFPLTLILMISVVGIPLSMILTGLFILIIYLSKIVIAHFLGRWVADTLNLSDSSSYLTFALGLLLYHTLRVIPYVGSIVLVATIIVGTGAILLLLKRGVYSGRSQLLRREIPVVPTPPLNSEPTTYA